MSGYMGVGLNCYLCVRARKLITAHFIYIVLVERHISSAFNMIMSSYALRNETGMAESFKQGDRFVYFAQ